MRSTRQNSDAPLSDVLEGRRVLVVNAIRSDVPSGGNTSTSNMLDRWRAICSIEEISLNPRGPRISLLSFALLTLPAPLFVLLARRSGLIWLEFLTRVSPWLYLKCLWARWRIRPEVVIFNHHASFFFIYAFFGCKCVLVWHDVPSLKRDEQRSIAQAARRCAAFERRALRRAHYNISFSINDHKRLRRLHGRHSTVIPVIDLPADHVRHNPERGIWLLVGNWTRRENCEGAEALFQSCLEILNDLRIETSNQPEFKIAGHGSEFFLSHLVKMNPEIKRMRISVNPRYHSMADFKNSVLVVPLLRGAGIKLKTVEAWSAGIPVIGTSQAFSGLPRSVWGFGGLQASSISKLARICMVTDESDEPMKNLLNLNALVAYEAYHAAVQRINEPSSYIEAR